MKSKRFSGLAKICVFTLLITCAAAFATAACKRKTSKRRSWLPVNILIAY